MPQIGAWYTENVCEMSELIHESTAWESGMEFLVWLNHRVLLAVKLGLQK